MTTVGKSGLRQIAPPGAGTWIRAKRCMNGNCVEVRLGPDGVSVRDSKQVAFPDRD